MKAQELEAKILIRERMRARRSGLDAAWVRACSARAQARLVALPEFGPAQRVGCYLALRHEVQTDAIVARCHADGRALYVPAYERATQRYGFAPCLPDTPMTRGPLGIPQPEEPEFVETASLEFIVVPGVGFDAACGRIGHGGGHYDRMLAGTTAVFKAGLAFDFQRVARVPMGDDDVRMQVVVTETTVLRAPSGAM